MENSAWISIYNIRILKCSPIMIWSNFIFPLSFYLEEQREWWWGKLSYFLWVHPAVLFCVHLFPRLSLGVWSHQKCSVLFNILSAFPLLVTLSFISFLWKLSKYQLMRPCLLLFKYHSINIYKYIIRRFKHNILP